MAKFRFVGEEPRQVSMLPHGGLRRVEPDEIFEVPDEHAESYESQPHFYERQDAPKPARKATPRKAD